MNLDISSPCRKKWPRPPGHSTIGPVQAAVGLWRHTALVINQNPQELKLCSYQQGTYLSISHLIALTVNFNFVIKIDVEHHISWISAEISYATKEVLTRRSCVRHPLKTAGIGCTDLKFRLLTKYCNMFISTTASVGKL